MYVFNPHVAVFNQALTGLLVWGVICSHKLGWLGWHVSK